MKSLAFVMTNLLLIGTAFADSTCVPGNPQSNQAYQAVQWYRDSAERNAIYREVFLIGDQKIQAMVKRQHLKSAQWGVIFDIDETLLNNSALDKQQILSCDTSRLDQVFNAFAIQGISTALPGAKKLTCAIQKMGGIVSLVSNRNGAYTNSATQKTLMQVTIANLKAQGICFNQVLLSDGKNYDKNPRFEAVQSGVYPAEGQGMTYDKKLPAHSVIAYFGDNIQDFPKLKQAQIYSQDPNGSAYDLFGEKYFALPNPMYGSWQANSFN